MPAIPFVMPPVAGGGVAQLCDASVTGVLSAGIPAPPAQVGGTDRAPIDDPGPAAASTGAAPIAAPAPPIPPTGATFPARAEPRPPMSEPAVAGPANAVSRPPPPRPMRSEPADAQLPTWTLVRLPMLLPKNEPLSALPTPLMKLARLSIGLVAAVPAADEAPDVAFDKEFAAAPAWLAASVS